MTQEKTNTEDHEEKRKNMDGKSKTYRPSDGTWLQPKNGGIRRVKTA